MYRQNELLKYQNLSAEKNHMCINILWYQVFIKKIISCIILLIIMNYVLK